MDHQSFLQQYERALGVHTWEAVEALIDDDACFIFSDGTFIGKAQIEKAIRKTFALIVDETYRIQDVLWVHIRDDCALCTYTFHWAGLMDGKPCEGRGRGTTLLVKSEFGWKVKHEHHGPPATSPSKNGVAINPILTERDEQAF